jgi:hypothetical protein
MNVLRMIKLFGWESRVAKEVGDKRSEELNYVWKRKVGGWQSSPEHTLM